MKIRYFALQLSLLCIILFIIQLIVPGFTELFLLKQNSFSEPWRYFTAIFLHGSLGHLMYNLFALALFGSILETKIGSKKFLLVFLTSGLLASIFASIYYPSSLGASGAIFGVIGALVVIEPFMMVWAAGLPMPMILAGLFWLLLDIGGLFSNDGVGHIAHIFGLFAGVLYGFILRNHIRKDKFFESKEIRYRIDESSIKNWEDSYMR
jgi:uncharacterized protein